ncbi:MAG: hypothetical protein ABI315_06805, partial [Bacteroidia bacterium]
GKRLGSFGNYAIFSLPKTFPINRGGLLVGGKLNKKNILFNESIHFEIEKEVKQFLPYLKAITKQRNYNYDFFLNKFFGFKKIFNTKHKTNPFLFGLITKYGLIKCINEIEFHPCYIKNGLFLPTNPFLIQDQLEYMVNQVLTNIEVNGN